MDVNVNKHRKLFTYFPVARKHTVKWLRDFSRLQDARLIDHEHLLPLNVRCRLDIAVRNFPNHQPPLPKIGNSQSRERYISFFAMRDEVYKESNNSNK